MSIFPQLRQYKLQELRHFFLGKVKPPVPEDEQELWLQEVAVHIAKMGAKGVDFLLSCVPQADELRLRAILLAMSFAKKTLSSGKRAEICDLAKSLLNEERAMVVAEAVDTLSHLSCRSAAKSVYPLLHHPSPYVVGSVLRFFARHDPGNAVSLLEKALNSEEPIVRQNAIDELDDLNYLPALPKIKRLLKDPDADVRQAAYTAVVHLGNG